MKPFDQADLQTYRLIILRRNGPEILLSGGAGWSLPCVQISPGKRGAQQLVTEIQREWGLQAYCFFIPNFITPGRYAQSGNYAVLESVKHNAEAPKRNLLDGL